MPFLCHHPGCTRSYQRREHLLRHHKAHADLRPFACQICPAAFNRKDLLNRHVALSHNAPRRRQPRASRKSNPELAIEKGANEDCTTEPDIQVKQVTPRLGDSLLIELGEEIVHASNRRLLEQLYFSHFHPHWPILHQYTFQNAAPPDELRHAVLVAGLWTIDTAEARQLAESCHDMLADRLCKFVYNNQNRELLTAPRPEYLSLFQTLMIASVLATYRGARAFPSSIPVHKRLAQLFRDAGVLDQRRIDAENPVGSIVREQYQRLALVIFKVFIHLNALLMVHLPMWPLLDHLDPSALSVRVPSSQKAWDANTSGDLQEPDDRSITVGGLFLGEADSQTYQTLTSISAWDFSTGMIMGCLFNKQPEESLFETMHRVTPFLFFHLKVRIKKDHGALIL
ncbi:hypothetical protein F5Y18DRAFT_407283 [Xylariaceae sp. FL1019]|nr:hypothetical protein F5Y18DRAFT_407283 [Xylariaceae sp. FL1019]